MEGDTAVAYAPSGPKVRGPVLRWWKEVVYIGVFYAVYTAIRNTQGSAKVGVTHAFNNAKAIIRWERILGIYHEETIQDWFLPYDHFIRFWNVYYGTAHFVVTFGALIWCFRAMPRRYPSMRNTLASMTGLALIGFALFPLLPPRLLPASYGFVDTLKDYGGLWSFDSGAMERISNQYAAMPSLHCGWAIWCTIVLWPLGRRALGKAVLIAYPLATVFGIVVTGNHYLLDAAGGVIALVAGAIGGHAVTRVWDRRLLDEARDHIEPGAPRRFARGRMESAGRPDAERGGSSGAQAG